METQFKNINAGIYALLCLCTGLVYVGASTRLLQRLHEQMVMLRSNRHYNAKLQADWLRLGQDCFIIAAVEPVEDASQLYEREKAWIEKCRQEGGVYNVVNAVTDGHKEAFKTVAAPTSSLDCTGHGARKYSFLSPIGTRVEVRGLRRLCAAYNLNVSHMSKVARGLLVQHRGWTLAKEAEAKQNPICFPEGTESQTLLS